MEVLKRLLLVVTVSILMVPGASWAQEAQDAPVDPRAETGGATTLEDILRRQRGEEVDMDFRRSNTGDPDGAMDAPDHVKQAEDEQRPTGKTAPGAFKKLQFRAGQWPGKCYEAPCRGL